MRSRMFMLCAALAPVGAGIAVVIGGCCSPGNQTPVASSQIVSTALNTTVNITSVAVDPDGAPGPLTWNLLSTPNPITQGTLHDPAGIAFPPVLPNVAFTPAVGFTGCAEFTFSVSDGAATSNVAVVRISVANQAPTASDGTYDVTANVPTALALVGNDPDNCPAGLTAQIVTPPMHGQITAINGLNATYTSTGDFVGTDTFTFRVSDGLATSGIATAQVNIAVSAVGREIILSLRNTDPNRYIHYHLHLIAFAKDIVPGDESRYTSFGYVHYAGGISVGCYNLTGRDLYYYYHQNGQFRSDISNTSAPLRAGIRPALASTVPSNDTFFSNRVVPLPSMILFHDPLTIVPTPFDTNRGATTINPALAVPTSCGGCLKCAQASWYYVTDLDAPNGLNRPCSTGRNDTNGPGRYFRVPAETQDTACWDCVLAPPLAGTEAAHWLHNTAINSAVGPLPPGNVNAVLCNEFYAGSVVTYYFTNAGDQVPGGSAATASPSLQWEVKTKSGTIIHSRPAS